MKKIKLLSSVFCILIAMIFCSVSVSASETCYSPYTEGMLTVPAVPSAMGIDVSAWQDDDIDWEKVANAGVQFAIIRVGHTNYANEYPGPNASGGKDDSYWPGFTYEDAYYRDNIINARANGIKVGVYVYSQATTPADAVGEAEFLLRRLKDLTIDLPVFFDFEFGPGHTGRLADAFSGVSRSEAREKGTEICLAFCDRISREGYVPGLYASASVFNDYFNMDEISPRAKVWVARYGSEVESKYYQDYDYWQYSSKGHVDGIRGYVDCDFAFDGEASNIPFKDIIYGRWYYQDIAYTYQHKLFAGVSNTSFAPNTVMSRAMLVSVLYRMEGSPFVSGTSAFKDLKANWYKNAVLWAEQNGITAGVSKTSFAPDVNLTREQLAAILYRYADYKGFDTGSAADLKVYADSSKISRFAVVPMRWAVAQSLVSGYTNKNLGPKDDASRAQVAAIIARFCRKYNIF